MRFATKANKNHHIVTIGTWFLFRPHPNPSPKEKGKHPPQFAFSRGVKSSLLERI
jgi:hypothetical protein